MLSPPTRHVYPSMPGGLATVDGVSIIGPAAPDLGVIPFTVDGWDHRLVADVLGHEHGIGVRSGCFCAQPYVHHLLGMNRPDVARWVADATRGDLRRAPGLVRLSIGGYNTRGDVDHVIDALQQIVAYEVRGVYRQATDGTYLPVSCPPHANVSGELSNARPTVCIAAVRA